MQFKQIQTIKSFYKKIHYTIKSENFRSIFFSLNRYKTTIMDFLMTKTGCLK